MSKPDYSPINWLSIDPNIRGFGGIRHYQITLINDRIPVKLVKKCNFIYQEEMEA